MYNNEPKERVYGWGRTTFSNSMVYRPSSIIQIHSIIEDAKKRKLKITCRGSGRSYGDNTLNSNQIVLDISEMNKILSWDTYFTENTILRTRLSSKFCILHCNVGIF